MAYGLTKSLDLESGSSQYASITDASQTGLDVTGDITLEAWVKPETHSSARIVNRQDASKSGYSLRLDAGGSISAYFSINNNATRTSSQSTSGALSVGEWAHIAVTIDVSAKVFSFYKNGVLLTSSGATGSATSIQSNTSNFNIGYWQSGNPSLYDGKIGLVRVWDTIRTQSEIADNICNVLGSTANLQAEWTLDNVYTDNSGNANTLTPSASPVFATDVPSTCGSTPSVNGNFLAFF